ncbi:N-acetylmuramoyl-L-alanine amidase [Enterococcus faecium]|uniref:N-acetylmuramoyl-L-alanine amidase n=1 Tax=Enterococcus faecium TaxID=1352 RepID=UPI0028046157|nr:N-acetylmuramoyl-L-alanine amidase [Enterococcus faecium]
MVYKVERRIRPGLPQVGYAPYGQVHAHSTGNPRSTVQNEADYFHNKDITTGFYTHIVGNGRVIQLAEVNRGAWDVGGGWNQWGYASVELIESHSNKDEFMRDYKIYCELLHDLAKQAGLPTTVDQGNTGIITHNYATHNQPNNSSDHVDPIPYLAKWGINLAQFRSDVANAKSNNKPAPSKPKTHDQAVAESPVKHQGNAYGKLEYLNMPSKGKLKVRGWLVPDKPTGVIGSQACIILLEKGTNKELARMMVPCTKRPDVKKAYSYKGGEHLGMEATFDVSWMKGKKVTVLFRRCNKSNGEGAVNDVHIMDIYFTV